jgi:hypothetical protein
MIKDTLKAVGGAARDLFRNPRASALLSALYAALLACVYVFFATGVANVWQLVLSALTALAAPLLLFVLLAAVAHVALNREGFGTLARRTLRDFLKIALLGLPLIALAVGVVYLLGKLEAHLPQVQEASRVYAPSSLASKPGPLHWQEALVSSLWLLLLGVVLPLIAAHLWLSTARNGLAATLRVVHRVVGRAFAPQSVLVYLVGLFVFGLMPYFVIYTRTSVSNGWVEVALFALRLALAFVFTLWGWTITLGALARTTPDARTAAAIADEPAGATTPDPAGGEPQLQA